MNNPLNKQQEKLRGKKVTDMTLDELSIWVKACDKMENSGIANKARRNWTTSRTEAIAEIEKRIQK